MKWQLIGPFDNVDDKGWDVAYPPEAKIDLAAEYDGQKGKVKWIDHTTADDYGVVDLNKIQGKHKGAITYAYAEFVADKDQPCDLRLGCINANKIWLNGKLLTANHVYHAGTEIDQYIAQGKLNKGKNAILLKICQNEQTEPGPRTGNSSSASATPSAPRSCRRTGRRRRWPASVIRR